MAAKVQWRIEVKSSSTTSVYTIQLLHDEQWVCTCESMKWNPHCQHIEVAQELYDQAHEGEVPGKEKYEKEKFEHRNERRKEAKVTTFPPG